MSVGEDTTTAYGQTVPRGSTFFDLVGMGPSAHHYGLMRREMDSPDLAEKHRLPDENVGFTDFLVNTHRQDYCGRGPTDRSPDRTALTEANPYR